MLSKVRFEGGVQAVVATAELHTAADVAQRIIPAVAPLAMDPIEGVREQAISAITAFVKA